jgi:hypothetical protein
MKEMGRTVKVLERSGQETGKLVSRDERKERERES